MTGLSQGRSRRIKAAILASPPRALRMLLAERLAARRETQAERQRLYRARQTRQIRSSFAADVVIKGASA